MYEVLDGDGDNVPAPICGGRDCDDSSALIDGVTERCDGLDNDCDARIDEATDSCGPMTSCREGRCQCDDTTMLACGAGCVDVRSNLEHCGGCFRSCAGGTCVDGTCQCGALTDCGAGCTDTSSDPLNCSRCGVTCSGNPCAEGACVCGDPGEGCCPGNECSDGAICSGDRCVACGAPGEVCCAADACDAGAACDGETCNACGTIGEPCCPGSRCTTGACVEGMCADVPCLAPFPAWDAAGFPRCTSATLTCAMACTTRSCLDSCLGADTTAPFMGLDCADCYAHQILYCADRSGCDTQLRDLRCCEDMNCPPGSPASCSMTMCAAQNTAFSTCVAGTTCRRLDNLELRRCFP